jgi:hypothetical protein
MANIVITSQPLSATVVPGQNTTFSVNVSSDFSPVVYLYQWKKDSSNIPGATTSSYFINNPTVADFNGKNFSVSVSGLSAGVLQDVELSNNALLTVNSDVSRFAKFARGSESGEERFRRLKNLGYI